MARVRVPKELRPPERFKAFGNPKNFWGMERGLLFRVAGLFREPKVGEFFWCDAAYVMKKIPGDLDFGPRVILERVSP